VTPSAFATYRATRHFSSLDGLRALSIVPVIWHHSSLVPLPGLLGKGPAGVQLFFVISGYLVTTLLLRERDEPQGIALGRFYARRALRIFPLYYAVFGLVTLDALFAQASASRSHFLESWAYYATYTSNWWVDWQVPHAIIFGFAWTLAIEEQFYVMWPPVLRFARSSWPAVAFMGVLLVLSQTVTWTGIEAAFPAESFFRTFCLGLSSSIALGCLLAVALHHRVGFGVFSTLLSSRLAAPLALVASVACLAWHAHHLVFHLALCLWLASTVVNPNHGLAKLLNQPFVVRVGRLSYALYLTHFVAVGAARRLVGPEAPWLVFLVALPFALLLAELAHHVIERPFLRFKARFGAPTGAEVPAATPSTVTPSTVGAS
jgi:peptidoglycan/LPS O-acetylase OafA/YrhL